MEIPDIQPPPPGEDIIMSSPPTPPQLSTTGIEEIPAKIIKASGMHIYPKTIYIFTNF